MDAVVHERAIKGQDATPESDWHDWLENLSPPAMVPGKLLGPGTRLVVVSPHPDDEVLGSGGLLAWHAGRGGRVEIIAVTDGEASHRGDSAWPPERLSVTRYLELQRGLKRLGVASSSVTRLGLPDGEVAASKPLLVCALRALLRDGDVVVGPWSLDGHPDHDIIGEAVERVCAERECQLLRALIWMWDWSEPGDKRVPWQRLGALQLSTTARCRKALALSEHRTQLDRGNGGNGPILGVGIRARAERAYEYFLV